MRNVRVGNGRIFEVPDTWAEGEEMITKSMRYNQGRGSNLALQATCAQVAYGLFGDAFLAADPTQALCYLMQRICEREGAGLGEPK